MKRDEIFGEVFNFGPRKKCACGGKLVEDFKDAYTCDKCKYYEVEGEVVTYYDGTSTREFTQEELIRYKGAYYKKITKEADVGDLVMLHNPIKGRQIYTVKAFSGYETRSVIVSKNIEALTFKKYSLLVPIGKDARR